MTQPVEAHPPTTGYAVEVHGADGWTQVTPTYNTLPVARSAQRQVQKRQPGLPTRIVEETITRTIVKSETR